MWVIVRAPAGGEGRGGGAGGEEEPGEEEPGEEEPGEGFTFRRGGFLNSLLFEPARSPGPAIAWAVMERSGRTLLLFSLASFVAVVVFASALGPLQKHLAGTDAARALASFHTHFDQLCWLGSAALGAALHFLAGSFRGPAWAPRLLAASYAPGALVFSGAHVVKAIGLRSGSAGLPGAVFPALASVGGVALLVAAAAAGTIAWSLARGPAKLDEERRASPTG